MKRDWNLLRRIMLAVEAAPAQDWGTSEDSPSPWPEYTPAHVVEHTDLLIQAGYVDGISIAMAGNPGWVEVRLTWEGSAILDEIRGDARWGWIQAQIEERDLPAVADVITSLSRKYPPA